MNVPIPTLPPDLTPPQTASPQMASPQGAASQTRASSETVDLFDLVRELQNAGQTQAAQALADKAFAKGESARVKVFVPTLHRARERGVSSNFATPRAGALGGGGPVDHQGRPLSSYPSSSLMKAKNALRDAQSGNAPQATQMRVSNALGTLGAYQGIVDPSAITKVTFGLLKLASRIPLVQACINTRVNQGVDMEWRIRQKDKRAPLTRGARKVIESLTELMEHGGFAREPSRGSKRGALRRHPVTGEIGVFDGSGYDRALRYENYVAYLIRNVLEMGWATYRIEAGQDAKRFPVAWFRPVPAENVRRVLPPRPDFGYEGYQSQFDPPLQNVSYIELDPSSMGRDSTGEALREYTWEQMGTVERYPGVDAFNTAYPYCETEVCLELLASRANTQRFCAENYDNDHIPLGILSIIGETLGEEGFYEIQAQLAKGGGMGAFMRILYLHFLGAQPGAGVSFTPLKSQTGIEAMLQWALQFKTDTRDEILAVFQMNPEELGQRAFDVNGPKLSQSGPDANLAHSKSKGLKPLMRSLAASFTENIIELYDGDFEFAYDNLDGVNQEEDARVAQAYLGMGRTPNEVRDERDEPRLFRPVEPALWNTIERDLRRELGDQTDEAFASPEELREAVDRLYEEQLQKEGVPCIWSAAWDMPVGSANMMFQQMQSEQMQNQQFRQQKQQEAQQLQQQQMQAMMGAQGQAESGQSPQGQAGPEEQAPSQDTEQGGQEASLENGEQGGGEAAQGQSPEGAPQPMAF